MTIYCILGANEHTRVSQIQNRLRSCRSEAGELCSPAVAPHSKRFSQR